MGFIFVWYRKFVDQALLKYVVIWVEVVEFEERWLAGWLDKPLKHLNSCTRTA